jgi:hypothetical protein
MHVMIGFLSKGGMDFQVWQHDKRVRLYYETAKFLLWEIWTFY